MRYFLTSASRKQIFAEVSNLDARAANRFVADFPQFQVTAQTEIPLDYEYIVSPFTVVENKPVSLDKPVIRPISETHNFCTACQEYTLKARCLECGEKTYSPNAMSGGI